MSKHPNPKELPTKKRVAHHLAHDVGEGGLFTAQDLRRLCPGVEQVSRRLRDLRASGWRIESQRDDPRLPSGTYRVHTVGDPVWEDTCRPRQRGISAVDRRRTFEQDNHTCLVCGAVAGDDDGQGGTVRITVGHVRPRSLAESDPLGGPVRTECSRCNEATRDLFGETPDVSLLETKLRHSSRRDRNQIAAWLDAGGRVPTKAEHIYQEIRRHPAPVRQSLREYLDTLL